MNKIKKLTTMPIEEQPPIKHDSGTDIVTGEFFLFVKNKPLAFASKCTLSLSAEERDISNKMCGSWKTVIPGIKSFTISADSLITRLKGAESYDTLLASFKNGECLPFVVGEAKKTEGSSTGGKFEIDPALPSYKGSAIITSLELTSDNGQIASCSVSLAGTGELETVEPRP